jgi:hypothetical protein
MNLEPTSALLEETMKDQPKRQRDGRVCTALEHRFASRAHGWSGDGIALRPDLPRSAVLALGF